jgi:hypothetical protein
MTQLYTNNASTLLAGDITDLDTIFNVDAGTGARFPNPGGGEFFMVSLENTAGEQEICTCTDRAADQFTVVRGAEGTTPVAFLTGSRVECRLTAGSMGQFAQKDGYTMTGDIDLGGNAVKNGESINVPMRGDTGDTSQEIDVPSGGGPPTIGGDEIWNAGNDGTGSGLDADTLDDAERVEFGELANANTWDGNQTVANATPETPLKNTAGTGKSRIPFLDNADVLKGYVEHDADANTVTVAVRDAGDTADAAKVVLNQDGSIELTGSSLTNNGVDVIDQDELDTATSPVYAVNPFYNYGTGVDGTVVETINQSILPSILNYVDYTINSGVVVDLSSISGFIIIRATSSITITGTLTVEGKGAQGAQSATPGVRQNGGDGIYGGTGGGGFSMLDKSGSVFMKEGTGVSQGQGATQPDEAINILLEYPQLLGGGGVLYNRGNEPETVDAGPSINNPQDTVIYPVIGGGGGGQASNTSPGGPGGGVIMLIAPSITITPTGVVNADGAAGGGTAGRGGGGAIIVATPAGGYDDQTVSGVHALGGASGGTYGGGDGWVRELILP